jgi:hypothetical protein
MGRRNDDPAFDAQAFTTLNLESKPAKQKYTHRSPDSSKKDFAKQTVGRKQTPHGPRS